MASNLTPEQLAWLNAQFNPTSGAAGTLTDPSGQTWRPLETQSGGNMDNALSTTLTGWAKDTTPGAGYKGGSTYEQYSATGEDQGLQTVAHQGFMQTWGPFLLAAAPFAAEIAGVAALGEGAAAVGADAAAVGGAEATGVVGGGAGAAAGTGLGTLAGGAGVSGGAGAGMSSLAGSTVYPGAAASADIAAPAGLASTAGTAAGLGTVGAGTAALSGASKIIPALGTVATGVAGLAGANTIGNATTQAAATADPFGPYRKQYADMLAKLTADPSSITSTPGYEAGMQAVQRAGAAQGYTDSGNLAASLQKYGGDFYNNEVSQLSQLAGANINPSTAAQIQATGATNQQQLIGNSIGSLTAGAQALSNLASPTVGA